MHIFRSRRHSRKLSHAKINPSKVNQLSFLEGFMINDEESQIPSTQKDFSVQHDDMDEIINISGQKISHLNTNLSISI